MSGHHRNGDGVSHINELVSVKSAADQVMNSSDGAREAAGMAFQSQVNQLRSDAPGLFKHADGHAFDSTMLSKLNLASADQLLGDYGKKAKDS